MSKKSGKNASQERVTVERHDHVSILRAVKNPIQFYTLVALLIGPVLGVLAGCVAGSNQTLLIGGVILIWLALIVAVGVLMSRASGKGSGGGTREPQSVRELHLSESISSLRSAQKMFLQVLLKRFDLRRLDNGAGARLEVCFDNDTPAIWSDEGKRVLNRCIFPRAQEEMDNIQKILDGFLLRGTPLARPIRPTEFCFRFASGGTLPILRIEQRDYYCLFYREIRPVGWNIANGGCDTLEELLQPEATMKRELSEELIIIDPGSGQRYVFGDYPDRAEFVISHQLIHRLFPELRFESLTKYKVDLEVISGPDEVWVTMADGKPRGTQGCFLNINALDYGIEIDQIVRIPVRPTAILLDGELADITSPRADRPLSNLINAPVGLFSVETLNASLSSGTHCFLPDILFHGARRYGDDKTRLDSDRTDIVVDQFWQSKRGDLDEGEKTHYEETRKHELEYDLCPVTRAIITRFHNGAR